MLFMPRFHFYKTLKNKEKCLKIKNLRNKKNVSNVFYIYGHIHAAIVA